MNLSQLQAFVALAETESFTEAAYAVNLTQSAVSHALAALEGELGVTLLERNRKGVTALTPVGQKIMPHVRALLAQAEAIEQEARAAAGITAGKLRLGNTICLSPGVLAGVMTRFQQQYPDVDVVLFEGSLQEVTEWTENSLVDISFVPLPAAGTGSTLVTRDELYWVAASGHPFSTRQAITAADLRDESFIMPKADCSFQTLERVGVEASRLKRALRHQASDSATILAMVREGLGVTLMPRMMLPTKLELMVALPLEPRQYVSIGLALRSQKIASPAAKLFIQMALEWAHAQTQELLAEGV